MNSLAISGVEWTLNVIRAYVLGGLAFALLFDLFWAQRLDPGAQPGFNFRWLGHLNRRVILGIVIRLAVFAGIVAFWFLIDPKQVGGKANRDVITAVISFLWMAFDPALKWLGFRLLIIPGMSVLWPLFAVRLLRGKQHPIEKNAHRLAAKR